MHEFNQSLRYDRRMYAQDIRGSIAYAKALALIGILTKEEEQRIVDGLTAVGKEWDNVQVSFPETLLIPVFWFGFLLTPYAKNSSRLRQMTRTSTRRMSVD